MSNNPAKQHSGRKEPEKIVKLLADKYGVSVSLVQKVIAGDRTNEQIFTDYMEYRQRHNQLLKSVLNLVPFA